MLIHRLNGVVNGVRESAGINRLETENERVLQEWRSLKVGDRPPNPCRSTIATSRADRRKGRIPWV